MATLKDVAKAAGVSIKTVSRVVNGDPAVAPATRAVVEAAIRALDYWPDEAARAMRGAGTGTVAVVTDGAAPAAFTEMLRGVEAAVRARGMDTLVGMSFDGREGERRLLQRFRSQKAGGLVYHAGIHRPVELSDEAFPGPAVIVNGFSVGRDRAAVTADEEEIGYSLASHLLRLGHRRIAVLSLDPALRATALRAAGMRTAFAEAGVAFDPSSERPGEAGQGTGRGPGRLVAYEVARGLLRRPDRPTAFVCGNGPIAVQAHTAAASLGLRVPEDLSLVAVDEEPSFVPILHPALTVVRIPYAEMGRVALEWLLGPDAAAVGPGKSPRLQVPVRLDVHGSCRALA